MFSKELRQSIGFKFLIIVSAILLTSTVVISTLIAVNERTMLRHSLINKGKGLVSYIAKLSKDPLIMKDRIELDNIVNQSIKDEEVLYAVIQDGSGNLLTSQYASIDYYWPRVKDIVSGLPRDSKLKDIIAAVRKQGGVIEVFTPITSDTDTIGKVTLGLSEHKINQHIVKNIIFIIVPNLVVTFILGAILFIASKKMILDPITQLIRSTTRFAKGELTTRVEIKTTGEVLVLVESFNRMMEELGKAIVSKENELAERKRTEETLKESEKKYRLLAENVNDVIFVLDMNLNYTYVSPSVKILRGYEPEEVLKLPSIETLTPSSWDLAMKTVSEVMELEKSGFREIPISRTLQLEMRRKNGTTVWTEVKFSFIRDENKRPLGILGVTRDITEHKQASMELQISLEKLRKAMGGIIQAMASTVETRDPYTAGHQRRVADLARAIAQELGLPVDQVDGLRMAGIVHDLGKIAIPAEILSKPTKLSNIEWGLIKVHPQISYDILKDIDFPWPVAEIVLQHHERMDGSGYPQGLKGKEICLEAMILMVADVVEAMASHRPYRPALGIDAALEEIEKNKGTLYDSRVVEVCLGLFREKGFGFE